MQLITAKKGESTMKTRTVLACLLLGIAASASAIEPVQEGPREKALMFYFSKSFGGPTTQPARPVNLGLRLQHTSPLDLNQSVSLIDLRYALDGRGTLALAGVPALSLRLGLGDEEGSDSSGNSSSASTKISNRHPGWTAVAIVGALLAGACLFEFGVCEGDSDDPDSTYEPPRTPTGPG
jgi:hypothetical protein